MNYKTRHLRNSKSKQPRIFNFSVCSFALLYLLTGCETISASIEVGRAAAYFHFIPGQMTFAYTAPPTRLLTNGETMTHHN